VKKIILGLLTFIFFFSPQITYATPPGNLNDWMLTFNDEFDGVSLDYTKWGVTGRLGSRAVPSEDLAWYVNDAITVSNGALKLTAKHATITSDNPSWTSDYDPTLYPYTSGTIQSKVDANSPYIVNHYWGYGYYEARTKIPNKKGTWPAFWLLPAPGGWSPEIDIQEMHTIYPKKNLMTNHKNCGYPLIDGGKCDALGSLYVLPASDLGNFSTDFHTFAVDWEPNLIVWYVDGVERFRTSSFVPVINLNDPKGMTGMFVKFTLQIGRNYDPPNPANFPQQYEVDYVRVYQKKYACNRCSLINGCERTQFSSLTAACTQPASGTTVNRTTDCSCPQISGGNNDRCTPSCLASPTPTPIPCTDSDNGKMYTVKGNTCQGTNCSTDVCNSVGLVEYYCSNNQVVGESHLCGSGNTCSGGKCVVVPTNTPVPPTATPTLMSGDYDGDRDVDLADFGIWKGKYLAGNSTLVEFGVWKRGYLTN